ncbi:transposase [uncultured Prevotella sp.]|uniref:transposase n=1 Tax=uncultured Prevotella sp. TaxID=159272 RepID=UPI00259600BC|nr:transposase [uncultured Prevotella sp.]
MKRGRNKSLVAARDQRMFERYYYWTEIRRLRFDDAIRKLSEEEFFVSESRVMQVVRRMIQNGATVDGKQIEKPLFTGFKVAAPKVCLQKSRPCVARQLSLFPE